MILEHMGHISIATEIAHIAFYLGALFNIPFPKGVNVGLGIYISFMHLMCVGNSV